MRVEQRKEKKDGGWNKRKEGGGSEARREENLEDVRRSFEWISNRFNDRFNVVP